MWKWSLVRNDKTCNLAIAATATATGGALLRAAPTHTHSKMSAGIERERERDAGGLHILLLFRQNFTLSDRRDEAVGALQNTWKRKKTCNMQHNLHFHACPWSGEGVEGEQVVGLLRHYFWAESEAALIADNVEPNVKQKSSLHFSFSLPPSLSPFSLSFSSPRCFLLCFLFTCTPLKNPFPFPFWHICILLQISREIAAAAVSRAKCD